MNVTDIKTGEVKIIKCSRCNSINLKLGNTIGGGKIDTGELMWDFYIHCNDCGLDESMRINQNIEVLNH